MKVILAIISLLAGFSVFSQTTGPEKAFQWVDSVFRGDAFSFEKTEFDFPRDIREILLKFNNAVSADKEWFTAYSSHATPGQPLPYHEKFGISREEYRKIENMERIHPALIVIDTQNIAILRQEGKISFKGDGDGRILDYLEFYLDRKELVFAGDTIPFVPGVNMTFANIYGVFKGYTWRLGKTDLSKSLRADELTARLVEIDMGLRQPDNKPFLRIQYQDMESGISRANLDMSGFIRR